MPKSVDDIFKAGEQNDVPTLTGYVADEGSFSDDYGKVSVEEFQKRVKRQTDSLADDILKLYSTSTENDGAESQKTFARDMSMFSMYQWAANREKTCKTNAYTYLFVHPQPGTTKERYQTFHSSELPYIFNNLNQSNRPWTAEDWKIAETMSDYWVNFISSGDPNGNGLPLWPVFRKTPAETMELGDKMEPCLITNQEKFKVLEKLIENR